MIGVGIVGTLLTALTVGGVIMANGPAPTPVAFVAAPVAAVAPAPVVAPAAVPAPVAPVIAPAPAPDITQALAGFRPPAQPLQPGASDQCEIGQQLSVEITASNAREVGNIVRFRQCGVPGTGTSMERTGPLVWVDGVRAKGAELDDVTQGEDIAAIEVYPALAGIPAQFFDRSAVCGTILVWTKTK